MSLAAMDKQIRELTKVVQGLAKMTIEGFDRQSTGGRVSFARKGGPLPTVYEDLFVVVVRDPVAADKTLLVREVRYSALVAKPCTEADPSTCFYEWYGEDFDAYPLPGKKITEYSDLYQSATDPLNNDTPVVKCIRNHNTWVVEPRPVAEGGGGIRPAKVVSAAGTASTIVVQPVKRSGASWVNDGGQITVPLWGGQQGQDFATLVQNGPDATADYIPLVQFEGEWYAMQYFWLYAKTPLGNISRGDCGL